MRLPILAPFCSAVVLLAAACGGSGDSSRLSQAEFRAKANHICSRLHRQEQPDLRSNTKDAVDRNLGRIESALGQLKALRPPADDETRYQELLKSFEQSSAFVRANESQLIELTRKLRASAQDPQDFARYQHLVQPLAQQLRIAGTDATALGLTACANGLGGSSSNH